MSRRHPGRALAIAVVSVAGLILVPTGCAEERPVNLLFIAVDTLRADRLGCYGHDRDTSPGIDGLAARSARFNRAYAAAPWTKPSVAAMITGKHPAALGIDNIFSRLPDASETLAEILETSGYQTAGVVSHVMLSNKWNMGFGQGYQTYEESQAKGYRYISTAGVTTEALERLEQLTSRKTAPFFLFVHYFDPHFDYVDHPEFDFAPDHSDNLDGTESIGNMRERVASLGESDFELLRARYDEEVRHTDVGIARLLEGLEARGVADDTVVVLVADHGEEIGEKGWIGHARNLHEMIVRVPLLIRAPGVGHPRVVDQPVSLVGLTPTLLDLMGVEVAAHQFDSPSFASLVRGGPEQPDAGVFVEIDFPLQDPRISPVRLLKRAWIEAKYKLVVDDVTQQLELYDLETDPGEYHDLSGEQPELRDRMLARIRAHQAAPGRTPARATPAALTDDDLEKLRKLGYVEAP